MSISFIAALPASEQTKITARIREMISGFPAISGKGRVVFPYKTVLVNCTKTF